MLWGRLSRLYHYMIPPDCIAWMTCGLAASITKVPVHWPSFITPPSNITSPLAITRTRLALYEHCIQYSGLLETHAGSVYGCQYYYRCAIDTHLPLLYNGDETISMAEVYRRGLQPETAAIICEDKLPVLGNKLVEVWRRTDINIDTLVGILNRSIPRARHARMFWADAIHCLMWQDVPLKTTLLQLIKCTLLGNYKHARLAIDTAHRWRVYQMTAYECAQFIRDYSDAKGIEYILHEFLVYQHRINPETTDVVRLLFDLDVFTASVMCACDDLIRPSFRRNRLPMKQEIQRHRGVRTIPVRFPSAMSVFYYVAQCLRWTGKPLPMTIPPHLIRFTSFTRDILQYLELEKCESALANMDVDMLSDWQKHPPPDIAPEALQRLYSYALEWIFVTEFNVVELSDTVETKQQIALRQNLTIKGEVYGYSGKIILCLRCKCIRGCPIGWKPPRKKINTVGICFDNGKRYCLDCTSELHFVNLVGRMIFARVVASEKNVWPVVLCIQCAQIHVSQQPDSPCVACAKSIQAFNPGLVCYVGDRIRRRVSAKSFFVESDTGHLSKYWSCYDHYDVKSMKTIISTSEFEDHKRNAKVVSKVMKMAKGNRFSQASMSKFARQRTAAIQAARQT